MSEVRVERLGKSFGDVRAVDDLSFTVPGGRVVGLLGPNGAGKTTTLRCLLGLVRPDSGSATVDGHRYAELSHPTRRVGAVLEATGYHPARTARRHLRVVATATGVPRRRVDECLDQVALTEVADRRVGGLSLGMRQRLGLATALLGDPEVLVLDEPTTGFDPAGVHWLRGYLRQLADDGRTVLVSSHVLSEVERSADSVVVVADGRLVREASMADLIGGAGEPAIRVRTVQADELAVALYNAGATVERVASDALRATGATTDDVGMVARAASVAVRELTVERRDLESAFLDVLDSAPAAEPPAATGEPGDPGEATREVPNPAARTLEGSS